MRNRYSKQTNFFYKLKYDKCIESQHKTAFDYYCDEYGITCETIHLKTDITESDKTSATNITNDIYRDIVNYENQLDEVLRPFSISRQIGPIKSFIKLFHVFD